jgi:poly(3-hydroxyalkanoate) synthetase
MSSGKIVDRIVEWSTIPMEQYKPSQEDYIKILILSYMVNSFWFWQRRIINASL